MSKKELTADQQTAAMLYLTRKSNSLTVEQIAEQVGVSRRTIYRWIETDEWKQFCREEAVKIAEDRVGDVMDVLTQRALEGRNAKFMQMYLQVMGLIGSESVKIDVNNAETDSRSNEVIEAEIEDLKRQLGKDFIN